jgi:hypothetical protein
VLGVLLTGVGAFALFRATDLYDLLSTNSALAIGATALGATGGLLVLGVLILALGVAALIRGVGRRRAEPAAEVDESIGYQQERTTDDLSQLFPPADRV